MDIVLVYTVLIYLAAFAMLGWFAWFTYKLIKQHYNVAPLVYEIDADAEKQRQKEERGES
jgi:hypothetical protein